MRIWLLLFMLMPAAASAQGQRPPTVVEVATVSDDAAVEAVQLTGSLRANEQVAITPELPGRIREVHVAEGQAVAAGALLFTLDRALLGAERDEREAAHQLAQRNFRRAEEMLGKKLIAQSDYDQAKSNLDISLAALQSIQVRLSKLEIRAPFAGIVGLREVSVGEYVEAGRRLTRLAQLDPIKLDALVPERNLAALQPGLPVRVQIDALGGESFSGELVAIDPIVDPVSRTVAVRAQPVELTALEFDLLLHFAQHPGRVFSRAQLLDAVWGYSHDGYEHTVTTHINRLRSKLERDPMHPEWVLTVRGAGYKFKE